MKSSSHDRDAMKQILQDTFQLTGDDLTYACEFVETNLVSFTQSIPALLRAEKWEAILYGADRCKALGEHLNWPELSEVALALGEGAKSETRPAVAHAHHNLRGLVGRMRQPRTSAPPLRYKLD